MQNELIKHMVGRFLSWRLPENFNPDGGIIFNPVANAGTVHEYRHEPMGTNLFNATQAEAMVRHMLDGFPMQNEDYALREALGFGCTYDASLNLQGALDDLRGRFDPKDGGVIAGTIERVIDQLEAARAAQASQIEALTKERDEALDDVRIWKGEAETRSEGLVQLNLDRADLSVRAMIATERATAAEAKAAKMREALASRNMQILIRDIRPFAERGIGSIRIGMDDVRSILAVVDAAALDQEARP